MSNRMLELKTNWEIVSHAPNYEHIVSSVPENSSYEEQGKRAAHEFISTIGPFFNRTPDDKILLEFGSGPGRVTKHLVEYFGKIYAVDISKGMLRKLAKLHLPNVECIENNGLSLIGRIGPVHVIYSDSVFIHNKKTDVHKIFKQFNGCVINNGIVAFQLPIYNAPREGDSWIDVTVWTEKEIRALAHDNGFKVVVIWKNPGNFSFDKIGVYHHKLHVFRKP